MNQRLRNMLSAERAATGAGTHVRIATRGSALALAQVDLVAARLHALGATTERVVVETRGDRERLPFAEMGGQGFFTKAVQDALIDGRADLAVHSHKDLPSASVPELEVAAVPRRASVHDVLVMVPEAYDAAAGALPIREGATVGTSAARRRHQLLHVRPDLSLRELRGNVPTRLRRLRDRRASRLEFSEAGGEAARGSDHDGRLDGELDGGSESGPAGAMDGLVLAAAGIERLGLDLTDLVVAPLDPTTFLPSPAQGALALEIRRDDHELARLLTDVHDLEAGRTVAAERGLMAMLDGGCQLALGAYARLEPGLVRLRAYYEGATAEAVHATPEGAAMLVFELLGRPTRDGSRDASRDPARDASPSPALGPTPGPALAPAGDASAPHGKTDDGIAGLGATESGAVNGTRPGERERS